MGPERLVAHRPVALIRLIGIGELFVRNCIDNVSTHVRTSIYLC